MEKYNEIVSLLSSLQEDVEKFFVKDVNSAGTRVRKGLQNVIVAAKDLKKDVSSMRNEKKAVKFSSKSEKDGFVDN